MVVKRKSDPITVDLVSSDVEVDVVRQTKGAPVCFVPVEAEASTSERKQRAAADLRQLKDKSQKKELKKTKTAFDILMSKKEEQIAWKQAEESEKRIRFGGKAMKPGGTRPAPFYKIMTGMPIAVDAFRYGTIPGINAYFLSHAHSDHYTNLSKAWKSGPIYASRTTCNLIRHMLKVDDKWIHPLPDLVPTEIPNCGGVTVTLIPANHCPGSSLFLFEGLQTTAPTNPTRVYRYLHTGDMRASPAHVHCAAMQNKHIDTVYLDTTYLNPHYSFPSQPMVIAACAEMVSHRIRDGGEVPDAVALKTGESAFENWIKKKPGRENGLDGFVRVKKEIKEECGDGMGMVKEGVKQEDRQVEFKEELNEDEQKVMQAVLKDEETGETLDDVKDESEEIDPTEFEPEAQDEWISEFPEEFADSESMLPMSALDETKPIVPKTLVVVGTYSIGKERIAKGIAHALQSKIYADPRKMAILRCIEDDSDLKSLLVGNPYEAQVHLVPLRMIDTGTLNEYLLKLRGHFDKVVGFRCTGWTYRADAGTDFNPTVENLLRRDSNKRYTEAHLTLARGSNAKVQMYNVPYSEHSSFFELTAFALSFPWTKMIATVNIGSATSRLKMQKWFDKWAEERKRRIALGMDAIVPSRADDYW